MTPATYSRLKSLFHEVVDLDATAREDRLAQFTADDPEITAELRSLLAEHDRTGPFLESAGISFEAAIPERVANYRIERELGAGGSGRVFLAARAGDEFHRPVALKLLYGYAADREFGIMDLAEMPCQQGELLRDRAAWRVKAEQARQLRHRNMDGDA